MGKLLQRRKKRFHPFLVALEILQQKPGWWNTKNSLTHAIAVGHFEMIASPLGFFTAVFWRIPEVATEIIFAPQVKVKCERL